MSLKSDVIVKSYFTNKFHTGHGKTPGNFVIKYIAREGATETLTPLVAQEAPQFHEIDSMPTQRNNETLTAMEEYRSKLYLSHQLDQLDDLYGRGFGNHGLSYSRDELLAQAKHVQDLYQKGNTVAKMVLSFRTKYAVDRGILPKNFQHLQRGDFAGHVDQLKLRHAINSGMQQLANRGHYQNPLWVGAVQVDTDHLHAHMVLCDDIDYHKSHRLGRFGTPYLEERGELNPYEKDGFRVGLDHTLLSHRSIHPFHTQVEANEQEKQSNIANLVQYQFNDNTQIQLILASLPKNRDLWDADSDELIMQRPNELMESYLNTLTNKYDDQLGYTKTLSQLQQASQKRSWQETKSNRLSKPYYQHSVHNLRSSMKNRIYQQLASTLDTNPQLLSTSFLTQNARDPEALKQQIKYAFQHPNDNINLNMTLFAYRLTSYRQRLNDHVTQSQTYQQSRQAFDRQALNQPINVDAYAMRDFYKSEESFHDQAIDKYRYFFKLDGHDDQQLLVKYKSQSLALQSSRDAILKQGQRDGLWAVDLNSHTDWQSYRRDLGTKFLHDERFTDLLDNVVEDDYNTTSNNSPTVQTAIQNAIDDPTYSMPDLMVQALDDLGTQFPEYDAFGSNMGPATMRAHAKPSFALQQQISEYAFNIDTVSANMFQDGVIPAYDKVDGAQLIQEFMQHPTSEQVTRPPEPKPRDQFLTDSYFNQVKGIDLEDLGYDFSPQMDRHVDAVAQQTYATSNQNRRQATHQAMNFLSSTGQTQALSSFQVLDDQLMRNQRLSQSVAQTGQLATGFDDLSTTDFDDERQFQSISLSDANHVTRDQLSLLRDLDSQIQANELLPRATKPTRQHDRGQAQNK